MKGPTVIDGVNRGARRETPEPPRRAWRSPSHRPDRRACGWPGAGSRHHSSHPSFIARTPLLAERGDALGEVRAGSHLVAELLLQPLAGQRVIGDCGADLPL